MSNLKIVEFETDKLIPYARNPRKNDDAVMKMCADIKEFGFRVPIIATSDGSVVDGHLRLKAAQKLGLSTVPVVLADDLNDAQIKALRLVMNKSAEWAEWDFDLLNLELEELKNTDLELDVFDLDVRETSNKTVDLVDNKELPTSDFDDDQFECTCPKCGFKFNLNK